MSGEIKQRSRGSWQIRVYLGRDEHGKRIRKNETIRGKKADAERRLREILTDLDHGVVPSVERYKLAEWLYLWLEEVIAPKRAQKTYDRYELACRRHIVPQLGNVEISKLSPRHVEELEKNLLRGGMAPTGVQMIHNVLSGAMKHALRMELIYRDPVRAVSPPSAPKTEAYSPEIKQVMKLLALAAASGHYLSLCIHVIAYTGMRRGEVLGLRWAKVDLTERTLRVETSLVVAKSGKLMTTPKTERSRRTIDLDEQTVALLREHRERQQALADQLGVDLPEMVFPPNTLQGSCHPNTLASYVERLTEEASCPDITMRSLRHFHATVALQKKQNPVVVSQRMGHSSVSITTDIYAHVLPGWQRETAEAVADAISAAA